MMDELPVINKTSEVRWRGKPITEIETTLLRAIRSHTIAHIGMVHVEEMRAERNLPGYMEKRTFSLKQHLEAYLEWIEIELEHRRLLDGNAIHESLSTSE